MNASWASCPSETIQPAANRSPCFGKVEGVVVDDALFVFSAFFTMRLRFDRDFQPLSDFGSGPVRVFQVVKIAALDSVIELQQPELHVRQLPFQRVDRRRQSRWTFVRGDQNHISSCLVCLVRVRPSGSSGRAQTALPAPSGWTTGVKTA